MKPDFTTRCPTGSYKITLPREIAEDEDELVSSFWLPGSEVLLQTSSYRRTSGETIPASDRVKARVSQERLSNVEMLPFDIPGCNDVAGFRGLDSDGLSWRYIYAVWPDVTILATVSGKEDAIEREGGWAFDAIRSITRDDKYEATNS